MTRLQRLLKAADMMKGLILYSDGVMLKGGPEMPWDDLTTATEFLDALKAFDDVERGTEDNA